MLSDQASLSTSTSLPRRRRRRRWRITARFYKLVVLAGLIILFVSYLSTFITIAGLERQILGIKKRTAELEQRNKQLQAELDYLESDAYIEAEARELLGMVKEGETAYLLVSPQAPEFVVEKRPRSEPVVLH
ncbi:MAG TPA: septum formation initiator family protein [Firmicutes bacterium]|nr:septum formation initiator family protein [Bacillota bacterium]